ncbi:hypothetical protein HAX54_014627, partial [Datura stramonium]|nr:hypothetical protein [Datura stramonium]
MAREGKDSTIFTNGILRRNVNLYAKDKTLVLLCSNLAARSGVGVSMGLLAHQVGDGPSCIVLRLDGEDDGSSDLRWTIECIIAHRSRCPFAMEVWAMDRRACEDPSRPPS